MKSIDEAELSGLLDGELDPQRAAEVREAIASDSALKAEFERLSGLDMACARAAGKTAFRPHVSLPAAPSANAGAIEMGWQSIAAALAVLTIIYFVPKFWSAFLIGAFLHAVAFAGVLWMISHAVRPARATVPAS